MTNGHPQSLVPSPRTGWVTAMDASGDREPRDEGQMQEINRLKAGLYKERHHIRMLENTIDQKNVEMEKIREVRYRLFDFDVNISRSIR